MFTPPAFFENCRQLEELQQFCSNFCCNSERPKGPASIVARGPDSGREVKRDFTGSFHPMDRITALKALLDSVRLCD